MYCKQCIARPANYQQSVNIKVEENSQSVCWQGLLDHKSELFHGLHFVETAKITVFLSGFYEESLSYGIRNQNPPQKEQVDLIC